MNPRRKKRFTLILAVTAGLAAVIGLLLYALSQNIDLFYTPGELVEGKGPDKIKPEVGQRLRLGGLVLPGSVVRDQNSLKVTFKLIDNSGKAVAVNYEGILPDLFREGQGIVAQGALKDATTVDAFEVLAKHDENYMPPEVVDATSGLHYKPTPAGAQPQDAQQQAAQQQAAQQQDVQQKGVQQ